MAYHTKISLLPDQYEAIRSIREEVFLIEQAVPPELEYDELDPICIHVVAYDDSLAIGTGRLDLQHGGKLGRLAVRKSHRRRGAGSLMMQALEEFGRAEKLAEIWFHSQVSAIPFYQTLGYQAEGEIFWEANIPHRTMRKSLNGG